MTPKPQTHCPLPPAAPAARAPARAPLRAQALAVAGGASALLLAGCVGTTVKTFEVQENFGSVATYSRLFAAPPQQTCDASRAELRLRRAFTAPRTRLLQRFSAYPGGVHFLVELRAELLPHLKKDKRLIALDGELQELF